MVRFAQIAALALVLTLMGSHAADGLARVLAGLPSLAFAPPGTSQQLAVMWEALRRRTT